MGHTIEQKNETICLQLLPKYLYTWNVCKEMSKNLPFTLAVMCCNVSALLEMINLIHCVIS